MKSIHIFGISTPVGQSFKEILNSYYQTKNIFCYSRNGDPYIKYDLKIPNKSIIKNLHKNTIIISFAPIWDISNLFKYLYSFDKSIIKNIDSVILLSSTSILTKKFSTNNFDKDLYNKLRISEDYITNLSKRFKFNLSIIRPTLIYGSINHYSDQNITKIGKLMKIFPVIFFPKDTGLRQPIHIRQLGEVIYQIFDYYENNKKKSQVRVIEVGGDTSLSYLDMVYAIRDNLIKTKKISFCTIIKIPNKIFYFLTFPIFLISPKIFESFLRIQANLSGFSTYSIITNKKPLKFPVENI
tara:strand:- start:774 stop:1664 length:891 start_codon:yes stop_codon:yes gene_type:complete